MFEFSAFLLRRFCLHPSLRTMSTANGTRAAVAGLATDVSVNVLPSRKTDAKGGRPDHHLDDHQGKFTNPWESYRYVRSHQVLLVLGPTLAKQ